MVAETIRDIFNLFTHVRARMLRHTTQRTLQEMARLPGHLIDDVNARGLPSDRLLPPITGTRAKRRYFKNAYGSHKIYSFD
ncbi:hypothetical protein [Rhizobium tubonense]|uniref:Uncharacterized protein n=1 Tax=Rhizobium tubonense TaxID=484088 RepID=A0A2W4ENN5_9HYPH|nr:hypothetical protein [Rhizobium tubonense]PZM12853.1 hypothetical protein CPY51_14970 [Rhizobium tubonense]